MDNYTLIQNAAHRKAEAEHGGFSTLSRIDQADRWAAWQASVDTPRGAGARDTYFSDESPALMSPETPDYVAFERHSADYGQPAAPKGGPSGGNSSRAFAPDMFVPTSRARYDGGNDYAEAQPEEQPAAPVSAQPDPPPKRSFALYNEIVSRHRKVFGPEV